MHPVMPEPADGRRYVVPLTVTIRECARDDLSALEWYGLFSRHREIIRDAYARQQRGENLMLLAVANGFPVGQVWVNLLRKRAESAGVLWAVRVYPFLQNLGIGARLLAAAEQALRDRAFAFAEVGVEKGSRALRFYERLGYRRVGELREEYSFTTPDGERVSVPVDEWLLRKRLGVGEGALGEGATGGVGPGTRGG